jgi:hypothetical protein
MMDRHTFIRFAALFEAGLAVVAVLLGAVTGVRPTNLAPDLLPVAIGVAATIPLIAFYFVATRIRLRPLERIHDLLLSTLGRPLSECRWHELALLAALAGVCEEFLFRGVLQPLIGKLGAPAGWIGANLLFGFAHAVTPTYFVLAAAIGFYLSAVQAAAQGNLVAAMLAHGLYDWFAFVQVSREYRRTYGDSPQPFDDPSPSEFDETG